VEFVPGATVKDCGVAVDMPAGEKLDTDPVDWSVVNVGTVCSSPTCRSARSERQGTSSADDEETGRRVRRSPKPGTPATWRRDPASVQQLDWKRGGRR